jgi:hypothetical protein
MSRIRLVLGGAGGLLALFGVFRLITQVPLADVLVLVVWLIGALVIHDGVVSPLVVGAGWTVSRLVPPRARRYLQAALIVAAIVTVIAIPMMYRRDSQPKSKAILQQNFGANLTLLIGIIAAVTLLLYALHVARDRSATKQPDAPATSPE